MSYYQEILRLLPAQATAAAFIPIIQLVVSKLAKRQAVHKQRDLRERVNALNIFIASMNEISDGGEHHTACLKDALRERGLVFVQLASLTVQKNRISHRLLSRSGALRLFLLYVPSGPFSWALHWVFFILLTTTVTGVFRGLFHVAYLRTAILVPSLIGTFTLALLVRLVAFYVDRPKIGTQVLAANTV